MQSLESGSTQIPDDVAVNIAVTRPNNRARVAFYEHQATEGGGTDAVYQVPAGYRIKIISCYLTAMIVNAANGYVALAFNGDVVLNVYLEENGSFDGETPMSIQFDYETAPTLEELETVELIVDDEMQAIGGITYVLEEV